MFLIRAALGRIILFLDWLFSPKGVVRSEEFQHKVDCEMNKLSLYQFAACPFCVKVRRAMKRNSITLIIKDAKRCPVTRDELVKGGGKLKVPCLRIEDDKGEVSWMYESSMIIEYLENKLLSVQATNV